MNPLRLKITFMFHGHFLPVLIIFRSSIMEVSHYSHFVIQTSVLIFLKYICLLNNLSSILKDKENQKSNLICDNTKVQTL